MRTFPRRTLLRSAAGLAAAAPLTRFARWSAVARQLNPPSLIAPLDGLPLSPEDAAVVNAIVPVAVMVDNFPDGARPQIGLDRADIVYELLVEGGITRFMPVYLRQDAAWIEPVRSVRTPYLYVVSELGSVVLAHVGAAETEGPTDSGWQMRNWWLRHLDEIRNPVPFWRDRRRLAPHNACTDTLSVRTEALAQGWHGPPAIEPWTFKEDFEAVNVSDGAVEHLWFAWTERPQAAFAVDWFYDADRNSYLRWQAGAPHRDGGTSLPLVARNVIVQFDSASVINDEGHVLYVSTGAGPAYILQDGQLLSATWTKPERTSRTRYWDATGTEIAFNRGNSWVSVLPYGSPLGWE